MAQGHAGGAPSVVNRSTSRCGRINDPNTSAMLLCGSGIATCCIPASVHTTKRSPVISMLRQSPSSCGTIRTPAERPLRPIGEHKAHAFGNSASLCFSESVSVKRSRPLGAGQFADVSQNHVLVAESNSRVSSSLHCTTIRKGSLCDGGFLIGALAGYRSGNDPSVNRPGRRR